MPMTQVREAARALRAGRGSTIAVIATLALGLAGTTAVFSAVYGVLLAPLPYPSAERVVAIWDASPTSPRMGVSAPDFRDWHASATSVEAMAAFGGARAAVVGGRTPVVAGVFAVSADFFRVLGVVPALGRAWSAEERQPNGPAAVVVSDGFWRQVLGAPPTLDGVTVRVDGTSAAVIGVLPPGLGYPDGADVWTARERRPDESGRTAHNLRVIARLAPGVALAAAQAEMSAIAARLEAAYGDDHDGTDARVVPLQEEMVGRSRTMLLLLLGAVAVVLAASCVNAGHVLLARGAARRRELALRLALGADRRRLVHLFLTEALLMAVAAGALGLVLASWLVRLLVAVAPAGLPRVDAIGLHGPVVAFGLLLALCTPLAFGLLPALHAARLDPRAALAEGGRTIGDSRGRARQALLAIEVALSVLLLVGGGLLARSLSAVARVDPGFTPEGVLTVTTTVPPERADGPARAADFYRQWLERVAAVPGVERAGLINAPPLSGLDANGGFMLEGQSWDEVRRDWTAQSAFYRVATAGYFDAMRIPLVRGRTFDAGDAAGAEPVAVVNQALAARHFAGVDPIGRRLRFAGMDGPDEPWLTIVGVVGDVRFRDLGAPAAPEVYVHVPQRPARTAYFVTTVVRLRSEAAAATVGPALRAAMTDYAPDVPVEISSMAALVDRAVAARRFTVLALGLFAVVALALSAVGVYGVASFMVARQTPEIGIRLALGASPAAAAGAVVQGPCRAVAAGLGAGMLLAAAASTALQSALYEVGPADPVAYAAAVLALAAASALAIAIPARRATRLDPLVAMRVE